MAYQRRYRRRNYRRKPGYKRQFSNKRGYGMIDKTTAYTAYKMAGKALSLINAEEKLIDSDSSANVLNTPQFLLLNGVDLGTDNTNRIGRSIKMVSNYFRATVTKHASASTTFLRCLIVMDKQPNNVAPGITDILATSTMDSPRNIDESKRFVIIKDNTYVLNANNPQAFIKNYRKMSEHVEYNGTGNTVASISTNSLYLVLFSTETVNFPTVNYYNRLRFIDN